MPPRKDNARARETRLEAAPDLAALQRQLLATFRSRNCVYAVRVTGRLPSLRVRAVCKQPDGTPLVEAAARQLVFDLSGEEGDLVGFWCPSFSGPGIQVPGFHLHYISADRRRGGHVLALSAAEGAVARCIEVGRERASGVAAGRGLGAKLRSGPGGRSSHHSILPPLCSALSLLTSLQSIFLIQHQHQQR